MATTQNSLTERMKDQANKSLTTGGEKKPKTIADYINSMKGEIEKALPKHITAERLARVALTTIRTTPKLQTCNVQSLLAAIMQSAQLGLEPGALGHSYLVPYGQECQFIIGYKGMIDLMWRSGQYRTLYVQDVCENDEFAYERGDSPRLFHKPALSGRGTVRGYYLFAEYKDGGKFSHLMTLEEIEGHRMRSRAGNNGPWKTDYAAMCKKTVVRDASRWMPMSIELQRQMATDESVKSEIAPDMTEVADNGSVIDASFTVKDDVAAAETTEGGTASA